MNPNELHCRANQKVISDIDGRLISTEAAVDDIQTELEGKQDKLTFDTSPTEDSANPVTSGGVYTALGGKQDVLTFDDTPTEDSTNPVTSGGVYTALQSAGGSYTAGDGISISAEDVISLKGFEVVPSGSNWLNDYLEFPSGGTSYVTKKDTLIWIKVGSGESWPVLRAYLPKGSPVPNGEFSFNLIGGGYVKLYWVGNTYPHAIFNNSASSNISSSSYGVFFAGYFSDEGGYYAYKVNEKNTTVNKVSRTSSMSMGNTSDTITIVLMVR